MVTKGNLSEMFYNVMSCTLLSFIIWDINMFISVTYLSVKKCEHIRLLNLNFKAKRFY